MVLLNLCHWMYSNAYHSIVPMGNQIMVVAFQSVQLAQASFLQKKNQTLQNVLLISVMLRWHRASEACKNQSFQS